MGARRAVRLSCGLTSMLLLALAMGKAQTPSSPSVPASSTPASSTPAASAPSANAPSQGGGSASTPASAQELPAAPMQASSTNPSSTNRTLAGMIRGTVKSGNMPIPGAAVTISLTTASAAPSSTLRQTSPQASSGALPGAASESSPNKITTWTDVDGSYSAAVPAYGSYTVQVGMVAFANSVHTVVIDESHQTALANFEMTLLSRVPQAAPQPRRQAGQGTSGGQRGFQMLSALQNLSGQDAGANSMADVVPSGMPVPGIDPNSATESIAVTGNTSNPFNSMSGDELQQRINDARAQGGGFGGGFGGPGGGPGGGFGGGGPGRAMTIVGRRGFDLNHPHGSIYYGIGDSDFNAAPYALTGLQTNPPYQQNSFGGSVGGPLNIPHIYHGGTKTFFFVNYNGRRGSNPFDQFSTVPTLAERQGNFAALCQTGFNSAGVCNDVNTSGEVIDQLYSVNPTTGVRTPYANNLIPGFAGQTCPWSGTSSPTTGSAGVLQYIPCPNLPGDTQNFRYVTSTTSDLDDLNARVNYTIGAAPAFGRRGGGRGAPRNNLTFGFHYHATDSNITNPFPTVGGSTSVRAFDVPLGYVKSIGKLTNSLRFDFNRSRAHTQNLYAFNTDIDSALGINGVSTNPFDWGLPNISFGDFTSLQDTNPQLLRNQTFTFSDYVVYTHGKHSWRWGGDFRRVELNTEASSNARGSFTFSGTNTAQFDAAGQIIGTGNDFADFLLGLPQSTAVQFGEDNYHFHGNYWDLYLQDEWKLRGNLTLNMGLRYEYVSPLTEENNRIANLDLSPGVLNPALGTASVAVVTPGEAGPYSGSLPATLVRPDRKGFAPRLGFAWKPFSKMVVRGGYGINYNTGAYQTIAQQLAFQPPFSTAETNTQTFPGELTLLNGFPAPSGITNGYAVNPNYRFGYVQIRNLDIQQQLRPTLLLNIDYTGTKGTNLDILEAPNRMIQSGTITTRINGAQAFTFENSIGDAEANAGSVRLRKRLASGFSIGGIYTFSKSIDDASSIGAGATSAASTPGLGAGGTGAAGGGAGGATASAGSGANSVAQNPFDLSAERGLSSFNQTQRLTGDYLWELPFGHDKRWLTGNSPARAILGDWQWSGDFTIATGLPFTPRFVNSACEVSGGTSGTLRPDVVPGESVQLSHPSIGEWFNTAAFAGPAVCAYGDARRNSIIGPGSKVFDMALTKVIPLQESRTLEFRAQATNVFNIPNYSTIDTNLNSFTYGRVTGVGTMRQITLTARFRF